MADSRTILDKIPGRWRVPLAMALVAAITFAVWWPTLLNGFIDYDDPAYVTANMAVRQGLTAKGFVWAFTAFHAGNWHPLTWLSHMLDVQLFDLNPLGHHGTSLLLHLVNAVLLCLLFYRLTGFPGRSMAVALLFALHPLHVESVAWVAERKDVLSTLFFLLAILAYTGYARKPDLPRYLTVALLLGLGLMAKQMLVTLPLVLLLLDIWPLGRFGSRREAGRILLEKVPLLLMAALAALVTLRSQSAAGAVTAGDGGSSLVNAGNALISYVKYIGMMFWPADLALFYPFDPAAVTPLKVGGSVVVLGAVTAICLQQRKQRPCLLVGWGWYLVTLLPVIGFVRIGSQALADRYTYIPLTGLFLILVWVGAELAERRAGGWTVAAVGTTVVLVLLSILTVGQIRFWRSSHDLYTRALTVVDNNWLAHNNMAILLMEQYRFADAVRHFRESLRINPNQPEGYRNLGNALQSVGDTEGAVEAYRQAVRLRPDDPEGHFRLGYAYLVAGATDQAYGEYLHLQRLHDPRAESLLSSIRMRRGN